MKRIFLGERGLRAGWGALVFVVIYVALDAAQSRFMAAPTGGPIPASSAFEQEVTGLLIVLFATWVMSQIERRSFLSYGYREPRVIARLATGAAWGFVSLSLLVGILWKTGFLVFDGRLLNGAAVWRYALTWGLAFLVVGLLEESLLRGYLQHTLARGMGFWPAAVVLSLAFGAWHLTNGGETTLGLAMVAVGGMVFSLMLWYTKSLWWGIGFHAGWDWSQSYFYGTPDSGLVTQGHLLAEHPAGAPLWSGGTVGPEGSLFAPFVLIVIAVGLWVWWGRRRPPLSSE